MSEISKVRKDEIRQTEDYKKARKILRSLYYNIVVFRKKIDLTQPSFKRYEHHPNYANFRNNCHEFETTWKEANRVSIILRDLKTAKYPTREYESMSKMLSYLGLVESLGVALADAILILLIFNEREMHASSPFPKHVTKISELENIDFGYKLEFLEGEGIEIFKKLINKDTRNHIAHLKFSIQKNGEIRKKDSSPIDIDEDIKNFWHGVDVLRLVFEDLGLLSWFTGEHPFSKSKQ